MDDQNNKKGYDDFFRPSNDEQGSAEKSKSEISPLQDATAAPQEKGDKPSYYYSYGPFKANPQEEARAAGQTGAHQQPEIIQDQPYGTASSVTSATSYPREEEAQRQYTSEDNITLAKPPQKSQIRSFTSSQPSGKGPWQIREKNRTSFKAIFLSFLAGVVLVGGLMYTADINNWFTGAQQALTGQPQSTSASGTVASTTGGGDSSAAAIAARPDNIAQLFETASPAVVKIETFVNAANQGNGGGMMDDSFFRQFFGDSYPGTQSPQEGQGNMQQSGIGTGFFFDSSGYILTNEHVVGQSDQIKVIVQGFDKPFTAELLGSSYELDLAVLKITGDKAFPTLPLGSSDDINIGDWVVAIGNPYGYDHTITAGVLSAKERPIDIQDSQGQRQYEHLLQTDASINPGNSGGPLLNINGEVVGINTAVSSQAQGIGFAIPTSTIQGVLENLKNNEKPAIPFIGAELSDVTEEIAQQLGMDSVEGSIVRNVYYNSPAHQAELQQFDVIVGIDGKKYNNTSALIKAIQASKVGDKVQLNIVRKGAEMNLQVVIGDKNKFGVQ
ncbi:S1C family serine protease [Paenibacillus sp. sgz302251]|uniref:S1C family serine protease n=1 Tax=Paenibacillus sp. sgz302251 TaxID=3414493 RepID=UPI003C7E7209